MNASFDTKSTTEGILTLHLEPQDYQPSWHKKIAQYKQRVNIKGFRKGQAPLDTVKKLYGKQLLEEAVHQVAHQALINYIKDYKLDILGAPLLTSHTIYELSPEKLTSCTLSYKLGLTPDFELPNMGKLEVKAYKIDNVDEDNLDEITKELQKAHATFQQVEIAEKEHIVYGDLQIDEPQLKTPYYITLHSQKAFLHPLFLGKKPGDTVDLTREDLQALDELNPLPEACKKALFDTPAIRVTFYIKTIYQRELAKLDKNFYSKVLGATIETEKAFREGLTQAILQRDQQKADKLLYSTLKDTFLEAADIPLPDEILKIWLQTKANKPIDPEALPAQYPFYAKAIRWDLILDKLAELHTLTPSEKEIQERLIHYLEADSREQGQPQPEAQALQKRAENLLQNKENNLAKRIGRQLQEEKVLDLLKEKINIDQTAITSRAFYALLQKKQS